MRLIDADVLAESTCYGVCQECYEMYKGNNVTTNCSEIRLRFLRLINDAPTVDSVKHGHWLAVKGWDDANGEIDSVECSVCHDKQESEYWAKTYFHYCPNCGAKMDE